METQLVQASKSASLEGPGQLPRSTVPCSAYSGFALTLIPLPVKIFSFIESVR